MDELHKRKLIRQLEQANKAVEADDFDMMDHPQTHPQASLGAATLLTEVGGQMTEDRSQMTEDRKYVKRSQSLAFSRKSEALNPKSETDGFMGSDSGRGGHG